MAYVGEWGTYLHIPKCGGWGLRRFLVEHLGEGVEKPPFHGVPSHIKEPGFAVVRHPVDWLRSIFAYRQQQGWYMLEEAVNYWPVINGLTQWAAGYTWDEFVDELCNRDHDIVNVIYGMYRRPAIKFYQLEHIEDLLTDLGIDDHLPITHVTPGKPTVTAEQRRRLENVCRYSMRAYGYNHKPLTTINDANFLAEVASLRQRCRELETI